MASIYFNFMVRKKIYIIRLTNAHGGAEGVLNIIQSNLPGVINGDVENVCLFESFKVLGLLKGLFKVLVVVLKSDVVISSSIWTTSILGFVRMASLNTVRPKVVARESTDVLRRYDGRQLQKFKFLYKFYYSDFKLIAQTNGMRQNLALLGLKSTVIRNPYELQSNVTNNVFLGNIPEGEFILAVGRLIWEKGFDILIREFYLQDCIKNLVIIGSGPQFNDLQNSVLDNHQTHRVYLLGYIKKPYQYMLKARICVVSSRVEGFPNTLLEMIEFNGSVLTTRCVDGLDIIPVVKVCGMDNGDLANGITGLYHESPKSRFLRMSYLREKHSVQNFIHKISKYV